VVFTLPAQLSPLALQTPRTVYTLLFQTVAETLQTIARDPKHLGAEIGFLGVLHTWGQTLHHHPHIHCLVPAGGLAFDGMAWGSCPKRFFLPVRVLSRFFRRTFLTALRQAAAQERLSMQGQCQHWSSPSAWHQFLRALQQMEWVVYAKPHAHQAQALVIDLLPRVSVDRYSDAFSADSSDTQLQDNASRS
jgi:Putative transposase